MVDVQRKFEPVSSRVNFPDLEEAVLSRWRESDTFHQVDVVRKDAPLFIFYEGPPTANGSPGIHHALSRVFKDVIIRYWTMRGYRPLRRGGWDTHGLPVELEVEKELGLASKREVEDYGIEEFNRRCRESVFRYVKNWEAMTERAGVWLDMDQAYVTYENKYIETGWWIFKNLWDRNLIYEGYKVTPHCPRCVTSLSSHEVALGYKEDTPDPSIYVRFPLRDGQDQASVSTLVRLGYDRAADKWNGDPPALLIWTTTPWTLTANTAATISPKQEYVLVQAPEDRPTERLIVARGLQQQVLGDGWQEIASLCGGDMAGLSYQPPYVGSELADHVHRLYLADFVTTDTGTGIVHNAPAYGADDHELGQAQGLPTIHTVDLRGVIFSDAPGKGKFVKEADNDIMQDLENRGLLFKREIIYHTYPFCWRCGTALLYYAKSSWYIKTTAVKDQMVTNNQAINWYPEHIKEGRFGEWLRNNVDWAVSRERYWGTPLPIWKCDDCESYACIGSVDELRARATADTVGLVDNIDLHRPYVDRVTLTCTACGGTMSRIPEVADAWYDSGAMPFAQWDYPVTLPLPNGEVTLNSVDDLVASPYFPADYITEAIDQTRGWFYSLLALSTLITGKASYKNVISLGLILDDKGEKMSKSKGNVVDPWSVISKQGADALRWYLFTAGPAGVARRFSESLVQEALRRFMLTLWNTYSFFITYANIDGFDPQDHARLWEGEVGGPALAEAPDNELDRWIISELNDLVFSVTSLLEKYNPTDAGRRIEEFVDGLSNWYVRRSRRRFWKSENDDDKAWAYVTLYTCLLVLSKLMAPLTPFVADEMFRNLAPEGTVSSVHLADYPVAKESLIDDKLDRAVRLAMRIASLGRAARSKAGVKVRQPLARAFANVRPEDRELLPMIESQVLDELNVKALEPAEDAAVVNVKLRPNLPVLGPKYGKEVGRIRAGLEAADPLEVADLVRAGIPITVGDFTLEPDEVLVDVEELPGLAVALEGSIAVAIDTELTPELESEGLARELVHRLQDLRKKAGLHIADHIITHINGGDDRISAVLVTSGTYIKQETLSDALIYEPAPDGAYAEEQEVEGVMLTLAVRKV